MQIEIGKLCYSLHKLSSGIMLSVILFWVYYTIICAVCQAKTGEQWLICAILVDFYVYKTGYNRV